MRVFSRIALTLVVVLLATGSPLVASHFQADCPLQLVASTTFPATAQFYQSPHGAFRFGNLVFVLRGQALTTYNVTDLGDIQTKNVLPRQELLGSLGGRESAGGTAFANGFMYISSDAGLEIFDLRSVRPGSSGTPNLVSRTPDLHYRRLAINNNILAGVFPAYDYPCYVGGPTPNCNNSVDLFDVSDPTSPHMIGQIRSQFSPVGGINDVAFNFGFLAVTGQNGTAMYKVANVTTPALLVIVATPGTFLVSNTSNLLGVGNDTSILTYGVSSISAALTPMFLHTLATLRIEHSNPIMFHRQATFDEASSRLITMVDELDPQTLQPARTFAFDVFDYSVPMFEGSDPRQYEQVSYTDTDEVKYNPLSVGGFVYVVGEVSGIQEYGVCGQMQGRIETTTLSALPCPKNAGDPTVAEFHGWVTGTVRIATVEVRLDGNVIPAIESATENVVRTDIPSATPVQNWRVTISLAANLGIDPDPNHKDAPGVEHIITAIATDINGNQHQFASQRFFFTKNWQASCAQRRRAVQ